MTKTNEINSTDFLAVLPDAPDGVFLSRAVIDLASHIEEGTTCPCCGQFAKVYRRTINAPMARFLIWLVRSALRKKGAWFSVNDSPIIQNRRGGGDFAKLVHWGLIEQRQNAEKSKKTSGFWRPTRRGILFASNKISVSAYVYLYNNKRVGMSDSVISIVGALGRHFDYSELMKNSSVNDVVGDR